MEYTQHNGWGAIKESLYRSEKIHCIEFVWHVSCLMHTLNIKTSYIEFEMESDEDYLCRIPLMAQLCPAN